MKREMGLVPSSLLSHSSLASCLPRRSSDFDPYAVRGPRGEGTRECDSAHSCGRTEWPVVMVDSPRQYEESARLFGKGPAILFPETTKMWGGTRCHNLEVALEA